MQDYGDTVQWAGEIGGFDRQELLSKVAAVLVLSQAVPGPEGETWCEPGAYGRSGGGSKRDSRHRDEQRMLSWRSCRMSASRFLLT